MDKVNIRIIDTAQSRRPNLLRATSIGCLFAAVFFGPGILSDSAAMQWAGFVIVLAMVVLGVVAFSAEALTIEEARERLDQIETIRAK